MKYSELLLDVIDHGLLRSSNIGVNLSSAETFVKNNIKKNK